ncbi:hypothetical protein ACFLYV_05600 [Chloroflexota bacterium]
MSDNDRIVLKTILEQNRGELSTELTDSEYFEVFAAEQVLKKFDLSYEEIQTGVVGASLDGGFDSIHLFVNGSLVNDDTEIGIGAFSRDLSIDLHITQAKLETGIGVPYA